MLLAALGGLGGLLLANGTITVLMSFQLPLPIPVNFDVSLDHTVLWFTAGVSLLAGLVFGLAPSLQATNPDVAPTLKNEGTGGGRPRRFNLRDSLVVVQVAFSFVLLIGCRNGRSWVTIIRLRRCPTGVVSLRSSRGHGGAPESTQPCCFSSNNQEAP